jgi:hypothetical protein
LPHFLPAHPGLPVQSSPQAELPLNQEILLQNALLLTTNVPISKARNKKVFESIFVLVLYLNYSVFLEFFLFLKILNKNTLYLNESFLRGAIFTSIKNKYLEIKKPTIINV